MTEETHSWFRSPSGYRAFGWFYEVTAAFFLISGAIEVAKISPLLSVNVALAAVFAVVGQSWPSALLPASERPGCEH